VRYEIEAADIVLEIGRSLDLLQTCDDMQASRDQAALAGHGVLA